MFLHATPRDQKVVHEGFLTSGRLVRKVQVAGHGGIGVFSRLTVPGQRRCEGAVGLGKKGRPTKHWIPNRESFAGMGPTSDVYSEPALRAAASRIGIREPVSCQKVMSTVAQGLTSRIE